MHINVIGWYGHGNVGDEAYKLAFPLLFPDHTLDFSEKINQEEPASCIILGGGDVFYPSFTRQFHNLPASVRKVALSISLTANSDFESLKLFDRVYVRDYASALLASSHGFTNTTYMPDVTFMLTPDAAQGKEWLKNRFKESKNELYNKVVVCVVSNYISHAKLDTLARDLTQFLGVSQYMAKTADDTSASFVFLPFSTNEPWDDRVSNSWVANRCKWYRKNLVVWDAPDVQTTLNIIAAADACVSSRLHSSIFSTIAGTPFIDLTHHVKNLAFIDTVEKGEWSLPFWEFNIKEYKTLLNDFLSKPARNASLVKFSRLAKDRLRATTLL